MGKTDSRVAPANRGDLIDDTHSTSNLARHLAVAALAAAAAIGTPPASAAADIFMKIGDIKGESQDDKHKDEIDVLSWSWGTTQPGSVAEANPSIARRGRQCFSGLTIKKRLDKATPFLAAGATTSLNVPSATLTLRKQGGDQLEFFKVVLSDVTISGFAGGGASTDDAQTESVLLNFSAATVTYTPQSPAGAPAGSVSKSVPGC